MDFVSTRSLSAIDWNDTVRWHVVPGQEPNKYQGQDGYKQAFMDGVAEYNNYGSAVTNPKYRIDDEQALSLYAFKATGLHPKESRWGQINRRNRQQHSGKNMQELTLDNRDGSDGDKASHHANSIHILNSAKRPLPMHNSCDVPAIWINLLKLFLHGCQKK